MALEIQSVAKEGVNWLVLKGDLSSEASPKLKEAALVYLTDDPSPLILDMAEVPYIDSSGLGALIYLHKNWRERRRKMLLYNPSPLVKKFLATTGLLRVFRVAGTPQEVAEAVSEVEKQP